MHALRIAPLRRIPVQMRHLMRHALIIVSRFQIALLPLNVRPRHWGISIATILQAKCCVMTLANPISLLPVMTNSTPTTNVRTVLAVRVDQAVLVDREARAAWPALRGQVVRLVTQVAPAQGIPLAMRVLQAMQAQAETRVRQGIQGARAPEGTRARQVARALQAPAARQVRAVRLDRLGPQARVGLVECQPIGPVIQAGTTKAQVAAKSFATARALLGTPIAKRLVQTIAVQANRALTTTGWPNARAAQAARQAVPVQVVRRGRQGRQGRLVPLVRAALQRGPAIHLTTTNTHKATRHTAIATAKCGTLIVMLVARSTGVQQAKPASIRVVSLFASELFFAMSVTLGVGL